MNVNRKAYPIGALCVVTTDEGGTFDGRITKVEDYGIYVVATDPAVRRALNGSVLVAGDGTYGSIALKES